MIDLYLRADSEAELKAALGFAVSPQGAWRLAGHQWALDPFGAVVTVPAIIDSSGQITAAAVMDDRFHANLRLLDPALDALVPPELRLAPDTPCRVWA